MIWLKTLFLLLFSCLSAFATEYAAPFNQAREFPAYLAEGNASEQQALRAEVEAILKTRFENMTIPIPSADGQSYQRVRFIHWAQQEAQRLGFADRINFYPSGGLVRNNVTQIYQQVYEIKKREPKKPVLQILRDIKKDIPAEVFHTQIRGVGSDFDVLIGGLNDTELQTFNSTLEKQITQFEKKSGLMTSGKKGAGALKKSFVVIPDFKDVKTQIVKATGQGGLEGDFLFFDMKEAHLKDPHELGASIVKEVPYLEKYKGASDHLLNGKIAYHPPYDPAVVRVGGTDAQTVRALRTLSEAPWTSLQDVSGSFASEVRAVIAKGDLTPKAKEQLEKMVRNSRFGGGSNRFERLPEKPSEIDRLVSELKQKYPEHFKSFLAQSEPEELLAKFEKAPKGLRSATLEASQMPKALYHGVPSVEVLPSIARNGLILSRNDIKDGTTAAFGEGAYSSESYSFAKGYSRDAGVVIPIELKKDATVVDWSKVDHATKTQLTSEAAARKLPLNIYLHDQYGIAAIKNNHFMILDMGVIEQPVKNYSDILKFYAQNLQRIPAGQRSFVDVLSTLQIAKYAQMSGEPGIDRILQGAKAGGSGVNWEKMLAETFGRHPLDDVKALEGIELRDFSPTLQKRLVQKVTSPSFKRDLSEEIWHVDGSKTKVLRQTDSRVWTLQNLFARFRPVVSTSGTDEKFQNLSDAVRKQVSAALGEGSRLRTDILIDPLGYLSLLQDSRTPAEIKQQIRSVYASKPLASVLPSKIISQVNESANRGSYYFLSNLNLLPKAMVSEVLSKIDYTPKAQTYLQMSSFADGKITPVGEWYLNHDPKGFIDQIRENRTVLTQSDSEMLRRLEKAGLTVADHSSLSYMIINEGRLTDYGKWALDKSPQLVIQNLEKNIYTLKRLNLQELELLSKNGLHVTQILRANINLVEGGHLTDFGKWALDKDPKAALENLKKYSFKLNGLATKDLDLLLKKGLSRETFYESNRNLLVDGKLSEFGRWYVQNFDDASKEIRHWSLPEIKSGADLQLLVERGYPKDLVAQYANESALKEAGAVVTINSNRTRTIQFGNGEPITASYYGSSSTVSKPKTTDVAVDSKAPVKIPDRQKVLDQVIEKLQAGGACEL